MRSDQGKDLPRRCQEGHRIDAAEQAQDDESRQPVTIRGTRRGLDRLRHRWVLRLTMSDIRSGVNGGGSGEDWSTGATSAVLGWEDLIYCKLLSLIAIIKRVNLRGSETLRGTASLSPGLPRHPTSACDPPSALISPIATRSLTLRAGLPWEN